MIAGKASNALSRNGEAIPFVSLNFLPVGTADRLKVPITVHNDPVSLLLPLQSSCAQLRRRWDPRPRGGGRYLRNAPVGRRKRLRHQNTLPGGAQPPGVFV